jgi:capsule polysaccharide export protein KpsE/RkpR
MAAIPETDLLEIAPHSLEVLPNSNGNKPAPEQVIARLQLLWTRRRFLFRVAAISFLASTLLAFLIPARYRSTVALMPPDDQSGSELAMAATMAGKMSGGLAGLAGSVLGLKSSGDLFLGILGSRTVQDDLIAKFDLRRVYGKALWQDARTTLAERTEMSEDRKSGIISIAVTDRSPERAASLAQEYVSELNAVVSQLSTSSAHRERIFLESRLARVKGDLEAAEKDFGAFASQNAAIDIKEQGKAAVGAAATLQGQLIAAQSELEGLKQIYTDSNVRVRSLKARTQELQSQLEKIGGKPETAPGAPGADSGALYPSIRKLPLLGVAYADLYRQTRVQEAVFETLTQEYELAKVAEAKQTPSVKVLDPPNVPERKSYPPRLLIITIGTFLCCAVAMIGVLGKSGWEGIEERAPQRLLAQEVFRSAQASMPWASPNGSRFQAMTHRVWTRFHSRNGASSHTPEDQA